MIRRIAIAVCLSTMIAAPLLADAAEKKTLTLELIELTNGEQMFVSIVDSMLAGFQSSMFPAPKEGEELTPAELETREEGNRIFKRFRELFAEEMDYDRFIDEVLYPIYDRHFTIDEIRDQIAFYTSPTGRKVIEVTPALTADLLKDSGSFIIPVVERIQKRVEREEEVRKPWDRTMTDIDTLGYALDEYYDAEGVYPSVLELAELERYLVPDYLAALPLTDVWGNPYEYVTSPDQQNFRIISAGADGVIDWESRNFEEFDYGEQSPRYRDDLRDDIVNQWGYFVQVPTQSKAKWFAEDVDREE